MNFFYENSEAYFYVGVWLAITLTLMLIPYIIKSIYRACTVKSRARDMERARRNVEEITKRCANAVRNNDVEIIRSIIEGDRLPLDPYYGQAVSSQNGNDLREIKQMMKNIDDNTRTLKEWEIYNPYKGK
ncbi:MAG: hypothetical protein WCQ47_07115 [bacterium]